MLTVHLVAIAGLFASAAAQTISAGCINTIEIVSANPEAAACLSPSSLIAIAAGGTSTSVVQPIDNWLTTICAGPACSTATLNDIVQNVTTGCSSELAAQGLPAGSGSLVTPLVQQFYPTVRKIACLKQGSTNCVTQTLTNFQASVGPLTLSNIGQVISNPPSSVGANVTCTDCVKAAYTILNKDIPDVTSDTVAPLQSQCGASFTDGNTPSDVVESASNTIGGNANGAATSPNAALSSISIPTNGLIAGLGVSTTIVLSTVFTFLV